MKPLFQIILVAITAAAAQDWIERQPHAEGTIGAPFLANADEGISAHETVELGSHRRRSRVERFGIRGCGGVNDSVTTYRDCNVLNNAGAAFFFSGKSHTVTDTLIYNQSRDFSIQNGTEVKRERVEWRYLGKAKT
jgi:hypothetical protein